MALPTTDTSNPSATDLPAKTAHAAERVVEANTDTVTASSAAASTAFHELTKAYQELATKNAKNLADAIRALSAVKSPAEFIELQQKLISDGVQAAVIDSQNIAHLTAAVFTSAFEPVKNQIESIQQKAVH